MAKVNNAWCRPMATADLEIMFSHGTNPEQQREIRLELERRDDERYAPIPSVVDPADLVGEPMLFDPETFGVLF